MRLLPRSIRGRMLALAALAGALALAIAGLAATSILGRVVTDGVDRRLDSQIALLATAVRSDGRIDRGRLAVAGPALEAGRGWDWRIVGPQGSAERSRTMHPIEPGVGPERHRERPGPRTRFAAGPEGRRVHVREVVLGTAGGPVTIDASAPPGIVERPIREAVTPLVTLLATLIVLLAAAAVIQVVYGLRPLRRMERAVAAVRSGSRSGLPEEQPPELLPLARELNALVAANEAALSGARRSAANLAHALKTPVAALALELRNDPDRARIVERIDATLRHHLSRARDRSAPRGRRIEIGPAVDALASTVRMLAGGRVAISTDVEPGAEIAMDPADLDELLGNLLDNAVRHAGSEVVLRVRSEHAATLVRVGDDGPGIPEAERARAVLPGVRLDERGDGHGFGLAIARELVELYGGTMSLGTSEGGGLLVTVSVPRA